MLKTKTVKTLKKYRLHLWPWGKGGLLKWDIKCKHLKKQTDEYDLIPIKNLCKAKDTENKVYGQATE
jgi:hypothetical protein